MVIYSEGGSFEAKAATEQGEDRTAPASVVRLYLVDMIRGLLERAARGPIISMNSSGCGAGDEIWISDVGMFLHVLTAMTPATHGVEAVKYCQIQFLTGLRRRTGASSATPQAAHSTATSRLLLPPRPLLPSSSSSSSLPPQGFGATLPRHRAFSTSLLAATAGSWCPVSRPAPNGA